ncbi:hypothetical protein BWQ96_05229 [Gracilariopsis chorda]|uniref:Uncharacterized protein n=1 Tax=Gracilariopsis chorda TaxID=448386 RepID=A0A2V3IS93_9FLOR|nr:hypothetical protein BWQ96_05229 [Gracilariopsis chorda]|eukprot:PXF44982.1 hypothetical protein BWQ96_05229 [Gracilariopsis chorda]
MLSLCLIYGTCAHGVVRYVELSKLLLRRALASANRTEQESSIVGEIWNTAETGHSKFDVDLELEAEIEEYARTWGTDLLLDEKGI